MSEKSGKSGNGYPRVGVYICDCGANIAGTVDVKAVVDDAAALPGVVLAREYKYVCSEPGQELIRQDIQEQKLERVVVASCSPRMHEPTFQNAVAKAGLNPFYFAMANIREHVSWVIKDKEQATAKAKRLVRAAVSRVMSAGGALCPEGAGHGCGHGGGGRHRRNPGGPDHRRSGLPGVLSGADALHRRAHGPAGQDLPYPRLQHLNPRSEDDGCRSASQHYASDLQ